ncbi:jerky protein homolog-like [Mya arenaria]|uniref:jerky protein homolog-like n=1 Tax=Mya arenaria TaxID=6604 RepID=UPI0022DEB003|nr:jerky protein homolog-like [Mya arenaria]
MSFLRLPTIGKAVKKKRQYDTGLIAKAYKEVVESGMSVYKAAILYGLPESTLRDRTLGLQPVTNEHENLPSLGQPPTFTANEEKQLVEHLTYMASIGYGYTRSELLNLATDWAITLHRKKQSDPQFASSWYTGFKRRNPDVTLAKPQKLSVLRAKCTSEETINKYFAELEKVMKKHDLDNHPELIWNIDETGLMMEHNPRHVVCVKGMTPQAITSSRGKTVTIIACGSAAGIRLPPYYVFPGIRWNPDLLTGASPGSVGIMTESGWSNSLVFMEYLKQHFLRHVTTKDHPVMILFDGHKSHINLTLSAWGEANNVVFFVLPPHTSHVTQPLDVECFGPLKNIYHSECQSYMRRNPGMQINRYNIAEISSKAYNKGVCAENLISAFRKTGVFPRRRYSITPAKTAPSAIYTIDHTGDHVHSIANSQDVQPESFLESRRILKAVETTKKARKRKPTIMGDITSPSKKELMTPNENVKKPKKTVKEKKTKNAHLSPVPGPSGYCKILASSDTESECSYEVAEEDLCCVCRKFSPEPMNVAFTIELVNWGECDKCGHWTHLKYCSQVKVIRRQDEFLCPCCE